MGSWMNNDGLYIQYGVTKAEDNRGGEYRNDGQIREIELKITLSELTETETILSDTVFLPKCRILETEVVTHTAGATGAAIDLGLIQKDRVTERDYNGLWAALPLTAYDAAGEKTVVGIGHAQVGALVGTTTTDTNYISASRTTATAFTAGVIFVKIRYYTV